MASLAVHVLVLTIPLKQALEQRFFSPSNDGLSVILQTREFSPAPAIEKPLPRPVEKQLSPAPAPIVDESPAAQTMPVQSVAPMASTKELLESDFKQYEHPIYPRIARLQGLEGVVKLALWTQGEGYSIGRVEVVASSGFQILDEAAVNAAKKWVFTRAIDPDVKLTKNIIFQLAD